MESLYQKLFQFYNYLISKNIISSIDCEIPSGYYELLDIILQKLKEQYPDTKYRRPMKSVHYANRFTDAALKESAFKLDAIGDVLSYNNIINHDDAVEFFNDQIIEKEITQYSLIETI